MRRGSNPQAASSPPPPKSQSQRAGGSGDGKIICHSLRGGKLTAPSFAIFPAMRLRVGLRFMRLHFRAHKFNLINPISNVRSYPPRNFQANRAERFERSNQSSIRTALPTVRVSAFGHNPSAAWGTPAPLPNCVCLGSYQIFSCVRDTRGLAAQTQSFPLESRKFRPQRRHFAVEVRSSDPLAGFCVAACIR